MIATSKYSLGPDVVAAIAQAKNDFRINRLRPYDGKELLNPQAGRRGAQFFEAIVGAARPGDPQGAAGSRRLVLLAQSGVIAEMYFTDNHYRPGSWNKIIDF